jgi:predicted DNA-binding transcriptional regulator AlpA
MSTKHRRRGHRIEKRALTIPQFCHKWRLSRTSYYDLQSRGLGPTEMRITEPIIRISPRAEREWVAKKEAGESAPVPAFAPQSSLGGAESCQHDQTIARKQKITPGRDASLTASKPPNRRDQNAEAADTIPRRQKKKPADNKGLRRMQSVPRKNRAAQSAPRSSSTATRETLSSLFRSGRRSGRKIV